jgi:glycosyltransferase involved in cell wall biosynthesis
MADLAVIILTYNESQHLARALKHVAPIAKEIFVIDSFSSDDTVTIAQAHGAVVLTNEFTNYARQFQWGLDHAPITAGWILRLDADEIIEDDLATEIESKLTMLPMEVSGINLKRKTIFCGRWIKYGGRYPLTLLRIWRNGKARIESRWMDEHMLLIEGQSITFRGGFADHNLNDLTFFTDKHNKYATREAIDVINERHKLFVLDRHLDARGTSRQAAWKRAVKEKIYNRFPFEIGAFGYFLYRYVLRLGFLDGREGLIYHFLQGCWYRFLVGARVRELELALAVFGTAEAKRHELARLTGTSIDTPSIHEHA